MSSASKLYPSKVSMLSKRLGYFVDIELKCLVSLCKDGSLIRVGLGILSEYDLCLSYIKGFFLSSYLLSYFDLVI